VEVVMEEEFLEVPEDVINKRYNRSGLAPILVT
jgi:hypothetical protein